MRRPGAASEGESTLSWAARRSTRLTLLVNGGPSTSGSSQLKSRRASSSLGTRRLAQGVAPAHWWCWVHGAVRMQAAWPRTAAQFRGVRPLLLQCGCLRLQLQQALHRCVVAAACRKVKRRAAVLIAGCCSPWHCWEQPANGADIARCNCAVQCVNLLQTTCVWLSKRQSTACIGGATRRQFP